jgi:hypothetical protein
MLYFTVMLTYEQKLASGLEYALNEGSMHFDEKSEVHRTLRGITKRLDALNIPYALVGGMAMFAHGFRRFTEDVDLLVSRQSMDRIIQELEELGYVRPAGTSTKLRDSQTGVRIEFLITGGYPGDGKPKPVQFPDPAGHIVEIDGLKILNLPTLIDLKLASGMSAAHRLKDLADAQELIRVLQIPKNFGEKLNPSVREKFAELWTAVEQSPPEE